MVIHRCDVAIIGAGTAGLSAERAARSEGAKTLLIDDKFAGTVCATAGRAGQVCRRDAARDCRFVRLYAAKPDGQLIGAELFCPGANHMAHLWVWAIQRGETASSLLEMPFYYPTLEAGLKPALRAICQASTGGFPVNQDDSDPPGSWAAARSIERRRFRRTSRTARVKGCGSRDKTGKGQPQQNTCPAS